jgi:hypothetical protein
MAWHGRVLPDTDEPAPAGLPLMLFDPTTASPDMSAQSIVANLLRLLEVVDANRERWVQATETAEADLAEFALLAQTVPHLAQAAEFYRQRCVSLQAEVDRLRAGRRRDGRALREALGIWARIGAAVPSIPLSEGEWQQVASAADDADGVT